jgi:hypothetical protein
MPSPGGARPRALTPRAEQGPALAGDPGSWLKPGERPRYHRLQLGFSGRRGSGVRSRNPLAAGGAGQRTRKHTRPCLAIRRFNLVDRCPGQQDLLPPENCGRRYKPGTGSVRPGGRRSRWTRKWPQPPSDRTAFGWSDTAASQIDVPALVITASEAL